MAGARRPSTAKDDTVIRTKSRRSSRGTWKLFNTGATVLGGVVARQASTAAWRAATGRKPPTATEHPDISTAEALSWAALAGATVELTRVVINRRAVDYWLRSTGSLPPGIKAPAELTRRR